MPYECHQLQVGLALTKHVYAANLVTGSRGPELVPESVAVVQLFCMVQEMSTQLPV